MFRLCSCSSALAPAVCDVILLFQVYYYRRLSARAAALTDRETRPLVPKSAPNEPTGWATKTVQFAGALALVICFGLVAWWVTASDEGHGSGEHTPVDLPVKFEWKSQTLGWVSAATCTSELPFCLAALPR